MSKLSTKQESLRLAALRRLNILDTPPEKEFDDLTRLAALVCDVPIALLTLIDENRQWFKSRVGFDVCGTERGAAFCAHAILQKEIFVVPDATKDERFRDNPLVTGAPRIRFYAGAPLITEDGHALGTLCVIDRRPRRLSAKHRESLLALARQAVAQLSTRRQTAALVRSNELLEQSETRYRFLSEAVPQQVWTARADGQLDYGNERTIEYFGKSTDDELFGADWLDILHPDDVERTVEQWKRALSTGERYETEFRLRRARDGEYRWHLAQAVPMRDEAGAIIKWFGANTDIHERRLAAAALRKSEEYRNLFRHASDAILIFDPADEKVLDANERACEIYGFARDEFLGKSLRDISQEITRSETPLRELRSKGVYEEFETVQIRADGTPLHFLINSSLIEYEGQAAVLSINRDITERRRAAEKMRESEANLAAAQRITHLGSWEIELTDLRRINNNPVHWSDEVYRLFGYQPGGITVSINHYFDLIHPTDRKAVRRAFAESVSERRDLDIEYRVVLPDGAERVQHGRGEVIFDARADGAPPKFIGTVQDITERKRAEEKLRTSEQWLRAILDASRDGIIIEDAGEIAYVNDAYIKLLGYDAPEELAGKSISATLPPEEIERLSEFGRRRLRGEDAPTVYDFKGKRRDGTLVEVEGVVSTSVIGGRKYITTAVRDITERRQAEQKIQESELRYRRLFESNPNPIWIYDADTLEFLDVNEEAVRHYGYTREEFMKLTVADIRPPADLPQFRQRVAEVNAGIEKFYSIRHQKKNGAIIESDIGVQSIDYAGKRARFVMITDVTERKRAETKLRDSEYRLQTLLDSMSEGLVQVSNDEVIEFVNDRFCRMTGFCIDDLLGKVTLDVLFDEEGRKFVLEANRQRREGTAGQYELRLRKKDGGFLYVIVGGVPIVNQVGEVVGTMGVFTDITERRRAEEQLLHDAFHDGLTGLANRALFMDHLRMTIERGKSRRSNSYAVLFLDFDRFKIINDSLGHHEGDKLLIQIARRLESSVRTGDLVARLGGDEFVVLVGELADTNEALLVAERIQDDLKSAFSLASREVVISASIGVALSSAGHKRAEDMVRDADIAMYRAKAKGKAQYQIFNRRMHEHASKQLQLETEMRQALERSEFAVHYQPIINLQTDSLTGFEALVRWHHPKRGLIPPLEFIPAAEENGFILPLGAWILEESCRQLRRWQTDDAAAADLTVSVNLSCRQFSQFDLAAQIAAKLEATELDPRCLKLEITESHIMENSEAAVTTMNSLRALGVELSLDDFGTGYSSLSYLHRLPVNFLKIDRSFVMRMTKSRENREIVSTIIKLAQNMKMRVVAEGIESAEQLAQLKEIDCDYGQGYLLSKPLDARAAGIFIENSANDSPFRLAAAPVKFELAG